MRIIDPKTIATPELHQFLLGIVAPRPIAFASTIDEDGQPNLAPYSFFNCFSSNPPIVVFSSNRRVANNTTKDTLHNIQATGEVVINAVSYNIVRQMAVASIEYPKGTSEFVKAGLTPVPADLVRPFRVKESPAQLECKLKQVIPLGEMGGAGHLIICEVVRIHIDEAMLDEKGRINPHKMDLMGRMGRAYYVRASGEAVHTIFQDTKHPGIGFDHLPSSIQHSTILTGNNLGMLAGLPEKPAEADIQAVKTEQSVQEALASAQPLEELHRLAQKELAKENRELAARIAWLGEYL
ncbi:MAG: flavin reductase family protein [Phaeodactylibacter sp.]|nr:flavin reductase family protein [Phaeodactylibacter sp.]MCB0616475.1 flavin reductase family protein [Phaeodactylibacter sp.]MCB9299515.1 flavin reductase family protein [Lewinellaceae bacterium]HQU60199.1 flavin reductase family protein [Saprospiraceae bacterium]